MLNETFYLDGKSAEAYGIRLQRPIQFSGAVPVVEKVHISGRNGDLIFDTGAYENRQGAADCFCLADNVETAVEMAAALLLRDNGYRKLECTNDPEHYWLARVTNGPQIEDRLRKLNPFTVEFDCKPQRYVKSGEIPVSVKSGGILHNYTAFPALPLVTVSGTAGGTLQIGGVTVKILSLNGTLTLDSDTQNAYSGTLNKNSTISAPEFPRLNAGQNTVYYDGGITAVEIIPRWWTL